MMLVGIASTGGLSGFVLNKLRIKTGRAKRSAEKEPVVHKEDGMPAVLTINAHPVVDHEKWLQKRKELLRREKEYTHLRDEINQQRLDLPWEKVDKEYVFDSAKGKETLADLFDNRSQLIVYHFMLGPGWKEGCVGCSFLADHIGGVLTHLENHDVSLVVVSRAPVAEIEAFKRRMGWNFKWVSSYGNDFNYDYEVSFTQEQARRGKVRYNYELRDFASEELAGASSFYKDGSGEIFHTYSTYGRGGEPFLATYSFLDISPLGRNETGPRHDLGDWVRHHDRYGKGGYVDPTGRYHQQKEDGCCHQQ